MKRGKNILLLIGIVWTGIVLLLNIGRFFISALNGVSDFYLALIGINVLLYALWMLFPSILLLRNLRNKRSIMIATISIIVSVAYLLKDISALISLLPNYLLLSKLGLIDTYLTVILSYIKNSGLVVSLGQILIIIGSVLSLRKKEEPATTDSVNL